MNIRMYFTGDGNVSRKEKKIIKNQVKACITDIYKQKRSIENLQKLPIVPEEKWSIYSEIDMDRQKIDVFFPKKICKNTNYLLGKINMSTKDVLYLIDVDDLFFMAGQYYIWPSDEKKQIHITVIN
jgi:hypothetical protein